MKLNYKIRSRSHMRPFRTAIVCFSMIISVLMSAGSMEAQTSRLKALGSPSRSHIAIPLFFEQNLGQSGSEVKFTSRGSGFGLSLTPTEALLSLRSRKNISSLQHIRGLRNSTKAAAIAYETSALRMRFVGANRDAEVVGVDQLEGKVNYFIGNDPRKWLSSVPTYAKVQFRGIYPGIDLIYYGNGGQLEYDLQLRPHADPKAIRIGIDGAIKTELTRTGDLVLNTALGRLQLEKPFIYQMKDGTRTRINGKYVLQNAHEVGIQVSAYDKNRALVVDPALIFSTYLGGTGDAEGSGGTIDSQGNIYVVGSTTATNFQATQSTTLGTLTTDGSPVIVVSKLDPTGTNLLYTTYLSGGNGNSYRNGAESVAVDGNGYVYVSGTTTSTSFPVTSNAYQGTFPGGGATESVFLTKLSSDGASLLYSSYLGGATDQFCTSVAVDSSQVAYLSGYATHGFPITSTAFQSVDRSSSFANAFVSKLDTKLSGSASLAYSTYIGGSTGNGRAGEWVDHLALDNSSRVYIVGWTFASDYPVTSSAYQATSKAQYYMATGFLSEIDTTQTGAAGLVYSTYFGGSAATNSGEIGDVAVGVTVDSAGKVYITGSTESSDFPITVGPAVAAGASPGFLAKFDTTKANSASLLYSRVFGNDSGYFAGGGSVVADPLGNTYVAGETNDPYYPVTSDAVQQTLKSNGSAIDGLLSVFSSDASSILHATFLGSDTSTTAASAGYYTLATSIALDAKNNIYVTGRASGIALPTSQQAFQATLSGVEDFFVMKFGGLTTPTITNLSATSGLVGNSLTISGINFGSSGTVTFNGVTASTTSWTANSIAVTVPAGATTGNIVVTSGGVVSNGVKFTVLAGLAPFVLVQHAKKAANSTTSAPLAFAFNNTAGNWIGVCVRATGTSQVLSVSDSNANLYIQALTVNETGGGNTLSVFYAENIAGGPNTITVSDGTSSTLELIILEYSGVALYNSLDVTHSAIGSGTSPNSGTTTTTNGDLLLGEIISANGATFTAGTGYTQEDFVPASPNTLLMVEDRALLQAGSASSTASLSASGAWAAGLAAFKPGTGTTGTAPTITSISPLTGNNGTVVTISGYNFGVTPGTVRFNTTTASPTSWGPNSITVADPVGATDGYIVVTVNGVASNGVWFAQPFIANTSVTSGAVGAPVTINGTHFGATQGTVRFNGIAAAVTGWTSTSVSTSVPAGASNGPIVLTNSSGIPSNQITFSVTGAVPSVNGVAPTSGPVGTLVTIQGANFGSPQGTSTVKFNGVVAGTATQWTASQIKIPVPSGATTGNVVVTVGGLSDLQTKIFTVNGTSAVTGMSPTRGGVGTEVTITGANLGSTGTIKFNGVTASTWSWSSTLITVPVPTGATTGSVTLTVGGTQMTVGTFDVRSPIPSTATEFSYDAMGRVIQKTICTPMNCGTGATPLNLRVTYDMAGNETSVSYNGPTISYGIDSAGRVTQVTSSWVDTSHPATLATVDATNGYWPTGALHEVALANGLTESNVYDNRGQPCRINVNSSGTLLSTCSDAIPTGNLQDFKTGYNFGTADNGNVWSFIATGQQHFNRSYIYDNLNRLQSMSAPGDQCSGLQWTIDAWGNRAGQAATNGGTCFQSSFGVGTNNQIAGDQYDASGDLTNDGTYTYTYDAEGRLTTVVGGGTTASYVYDAFGQRAAKYVGGGDSEYVYDQANKLNTLFGNGVFQRGYAYLGSGAVAEYYNNTTYFVHADHLGSTRLVTALNATIAESDDYYPFGEAFGTGGSPDIHKFTGKERDAESGLDQFGARYYASSMGRFMTPDWAASPTGVPYADFGNPQSLNLYGYVQNNPLSRTDPDGHCDVDGEHHRGVWCAAHALGFTETKKEYAARMDWAMKHPITPGQSAALQGENAAVSIIMIGMAARGAQAPLDEELASAEATATQTTEAVEETQTAATNGGITAANGTKITGFTEHGVNRAIGDGAQGVAGARAGTRPEAILDALRNPAKITSGVDSQGRPYQVFTGQNARVVVNPQSGKIVSVNPTSGAGAH